MDGEYVVVSCSKLRILTFSIVFVRMQFLASIAGNVYMNTGERRPINIDSKAAEDDASGDSETRAKIVPPVSSYRNVS